jgi:hypothetical protein
MTSDVTAADYKKLQDISAFLKGEELFHLVADFPKKNKLVQWVTGEEVHAYLEEDLQFFGVLVHNVQKKLHDKVTKNSRLILHHWKKNMRNQHPFG